MGEWLKFPLYAIFIGANLGLASLHLLKQELSDLAITVKVPVIPFFLLSFVFSAFTCIFSSHLFIESYSWACIAAYVLLISYFFLIIFSCFLIFRSREITTQREIVAAVSKRIGEKIYEMIRKPR